MVTLQTRLSEGKQGIHQHNKIVQAFDADNLKRTKNLK